MLVQIGLDTFEGRGVLELYFRADLGNLTCYSQPEPRNYTGSGKGTHSLSGDVVGSGGGHMVWTKFVAVSADNTVASLRTQATTNTSGTR